MMKIALIGNGYWGSKIKKYVDNYFVLEYIANSKFDLNIIWNDADVTAVIIATPIDTHYEIAKDALLHGKHVFIEKPITLQINQANELYDIATSNNLKLVVEYTHTFSKGLQHIAESVEKIQYMEMGAKHLGRFMEYDVYWLLASHHLSILSMFFDLDQLKYKFTDHIYNGNICTAGTIDCTLNYKLIARIDVSLNYAGKELYVNIYGNKYFAKYSPTDTNSSYIVNYNKSYKKLPPELIIETDDFSTDEYNNLKHSIKYFNDVIENKCKSNIETAIKITSILESRGA